MKFKLEIVTPERQFYSGDVDSVILRGIEGDFAVLANRAPLITPLRIGLLKLYEDGDKDAKIAAISGGYVTVTKDKTTIITDSAEWADEIDKSRAEEAKKRAEDRLKSKDSNNTDIQRAEIALKRSLNRLECCNYK